MTAPSRIERAIARDLRETGCGLARYLEPARDELDRLVRDVRGSLLRPAALRPLEASVLAEGFMTEDAAEAWADEAARTIVASLTLTYRLVPREDGR